MSNETGWKESDGKFVYPADKQVVKITTKDGGLMDEPARFHRESVMDKAPRFVTAAAYFVKPSSVAAWSPIPDPANGA